MMGSVIYKCKNKTRCSPNRMGAKGKRALHSWAENGDMFPRPNRPRNKSLGLRRGRVSPTRRYVVHTKFHKAQRVCPEEAFPWTRAWDDGEGGPTAELGVQGLRNTQHLTYF